MGQTLYLECYSGISGAMTAAALLDLGADQNVLAHALESLPLEGYHTKISRVQKAGIDACGFHVILDSAYDSHSPDKKYLHDDIIEKISRTDITAGAKQTAIKIFTFLGEAASTGTIVDIVATAVCLDNLNITDVIIPILYEGCGTTLDQHCRLPVPVPAVSNIIKSHGLKLHITSTQGELLTPAGAAIAAAVRTLEQLPEEFKILRIGLGAGSREYKHPNIIRAVLIEPADRQNDTDDNVVYKLESNLDDCSGEALGYVLECLMEAGAKDVHYFPIFMKKSHPAFQLNVLCKEEDIPKLEQIIFNQTTTIGIRRLRMKRSILPRELKTVQTAYGEVQVKICGLDGQVRVYPEYDSLVRICRQTGGSYIEMYRTVQEICREKLYL